MRVPRTRKSAVQGLEAAQPSLPPDKAADYGTAIAEARRSLTQLEHADALPPRARMRQIEECGEVVRLELLHPPKLGNRRRLGLLARARLIPPQQVRHGDASLALPQDR